MVLVSIISFQSEMMSEKVKKILTNKNFHRKFNESVQLFDIGSITDGTGMLKCTGNGPSVH